MTKWELTAEDGQELYALAIRVSFTRLSTFETSFVSTPLSKCFVFRIHPIECRLLDYPPLGNTISEVFPPA
ncbi:hypothetical protein [Thalassotalea litorea]|uniref:hypothetical protein n=1 Tax=Thalassotalea litorea TaxID=2020715 RepID=UPI003736791B